MMGSSVQAYLTIYPIIFVLAMRPISNLISFITKLINSPEPGYFFAFNLRQDKYSYKLQQAHIQLSPKHSFSHLPKVDCKLALSLSAWACQQCKPAQQTNLVILFCKFCKVSITIADNFCFAFTYNMMDSQPSLMEINQVCYSSPYQIKGLDRPSDFDATCQECDKGLGHYIAQQGKTS